MDDHSGWYPDPTGRHQERYFNAAGIPTNLIRNDGHESRDEDRVESGATGSHEPRVIAQRIPTPTSMHSSAESTPPPGSDGTVRVPVARYTAPQPDPGYDDPTGQVAAVASQPASTLAPRRSSPWLIAVACVLGVLAIGASVFAVQQHSQANKWKNDYHAEVTQYRSESHKSTGLFVSLLAAQHNLSLVTFQKDAICHQLDAPYQHPDPTIAAACSG